MIQKKRYARPGGLICLLLAGFSISYFSCQKQAVLESIKQEEKLSDEITLNDDPTSSGEVNNTEGCSFISWYNPITGTPNPDYEITCWNTKPKWWPNLNTMPDIPVPGWYLPAPPPDETIHMDLQTMPAARYYVRWGVNNYSPVLGDTSSFITPAGLNLNAGQMLFLDDHFAQQTLLFDDYYTRFLATGKLLIDQELVDMFQVYCFFKTSIALYETQPNFFGEQTPGNSFATTLDTTLLTQQMNTVGPSSYTVQHLLNTCFVPVQDMTIGKHKLRLPRWYFYYFLSSQELPGYIVLR